MPLIDSEEFRRRALQVYPEYWENVLDDMLDNEVHELHDRKVGKWNRVGNTGLAQCECGFMTDRYRVYDFCPKCGHKMKQED